MSEHRSILIVEDEVIISMRLEMFFKRRGYEISGCASTGDEAIEMAVKKNLV